MKTYTIYNTDIELQDYEEYIAEEYAELETEEEKYTLCNYLKEEEYFDAKDLLNIQLNNDIYCIGDIGRWNGRQYGYKVIKSGNIQDILYSECDFCNWYIDKHKNIRFEGAHHDGRSYYLYREVKSSLTDTQRENFEELLYSGKATQRHITYYTKAIGVHVLKAWGVVQ
jgi:hypothetical protein